MSSTPPTSQTRNALVYCVDAEMLPLALLSARDALENTANRTFDILICSLDPLTPPASLAHLDIRYETLPLRDEITSHNLPLGWLPITAYLRLWLCREFLDRYDRLIYIDADTMIPGSDLSTLFHLNMAENPVAGVRDVMQWRRLDRGIHDFDKRGIHGVPYLNSGIVLFDVARFTASGCLPRMLAFAAEDCDLMHHDQSLLNLALIHERTELSPVWNWQWSRDLPFFSFLARPQILHFCGYPKPWEPHGAPRFSAELQHRYARFFAAHFPDRAFDPPPAAKVRLTRWQTLSLFAAHLWCLPALFRMMRRFKSDTDVIT